MESPAPGKDPANSKASDSEAANALKQMEKMALFMKPEDMPEDPSQNDDLAAIQALIYDDQTPEEIAENFKDQGNHALTKHKRFIPDAVKFYTQAIDQKVEDPVRNSIYYANRSHANLLLGNYRRALQDSQEAVRLNPDNIKAYFRAAKAAFNLGEYDEAVQQAMAGLEKDPENEELRKWKEKAEKEVAVTRARRDREAKALADSQRLAKALVEREVKVGPPAYKQQRGGKVPWIDESNLIHWPVLFVYGETMVTDFIEDFMETDNFRFHLDDMFGDGAPPLAWDQRREYTRDRVQLYYQENAMKPLPQTRWPEVFLSDPGATAAAETVEDAATSTSFVTHPEDRRWRRIEEQDTLGAILARPGHVIPGIPVFYVTSENSSFASRMSNGQWVPP
ncbi:hypothetical protein KFL_000450440 [Klebsormidium nitens]|uniref:Cns1/TTC4 wheel domain-containing protein n=1 Tax=Klebsormidium nitens TaxID=105231 RepID=A0A1Y1HU73_KLENI|nr:hypothetical protein KFL_000450440 [Klebsormidium nitens]|eukprot:GAQ80087.1 hypothetical protein KFL_000450440 [Klebsormidium nitens]